MTTWEHRNNITTNERGPTLVFEGTTRLRIRQQIRDQLSDFLDKNPEVWDLEHADGWEGRLRRTRAPCYQLRAMFRQ